MPFGINCKAMYFVKMVKLLSKSWHFLNQDIPLTPALPYKAEISKLLTADIPGTYHFTDDQKKIFLTAVTVGVVVFGSPNPVFAQIVIADEINKVGAIGAMLEDMVSSMTNVLAGSGGASAAFQVFRRIILNNL